MSDFVLNDEYTNMVNNTNIIKFDMTPINKEYRDIYRRPYDLNISNGSLDRLKNVIDHHNAQGSTISERAVINATPGVIRTSNMPSSMVDIPNGWSTNRYRFIMVVENRTSESLVKRSYIQGYSEYYDPAVGGSVDYNLEFFINSVLDVNYFQLVDGTIKSSITGSYHLLYNPTTQGNGYEVNHTMLKTARPSDVLNSINQLDTNSTDDLGSVNEYNSDKVKVSNRTHADGVKHLTTVLNGSNASNYGTDISYNRVDRVSAAVNIVADINISDSLFFSAFAIITGVVDTRGFTLNQLATIDNNVGSIVQEHQNHTMVRQYDSSINNIMESSDSHDFLDSGEETRIAMTVMNTVSSYMANRFISRCALYLSNMQNESTCNVVDIASMVEGIDPAPYGNGVQMEVISNLMPEITQNGDLLLEIGVEIDLLGNGTVAVSINGGEAYKYDVPTFSDALYVPVIGTVEDNQRLNTDYSTLTRALGLS